MSRRVIIYHNNNERNFIRASLFSCGCVRLFTHSNLQQVFPAGGFLLCPSCTEVLPTQDLANKHIRSCIMNDCVESFDFTTPVRKIETGNDVFWRSAKDTSAVQAEVFYEGEITGKSVGMLYTLCLQ